MHDFIIVDKKKKKQRGKKKINEKYIFCPVQEVEPVVVPDFIASVNRLREAISAISRQLNANKLAGRRYDNLKLQEEELKVFEFNLILI